MVGYNYFRNGRHTNSVGAKDMEKNAVMFRNRIKINRDGWKNFEDVDVFIATISEKLQTIQDEMLARANARLTQNVVTDIKPAAEFEAYFANANVYLENGGVKAVEDWIL